MVKHRVTETKLRSILKALTGRALEVAVGTFLISFLVLRNLELSFKLAIFNEAICAVTTYINERVWNLSQWGRKVIHEPIRLGDVGE